MCAAAFSPSVLGAKELPNIIYSNRPTDSFGNELHGKY